MPRIRTSTLTGLHIIRHGHAEVISPRNSHNFPATFISNVKICKNCLYPNLYNPYIFGIARHSAVQIRYQKVRIISSQAVPIQIVDPIDFYKCDIDPAPVAGRQASRLISSSGSVNNTIPASVFEGSRDQKRSL